MKTLEKKTKTVGIRQRFPKEVLDDPRVSREIGVLKCIQCGRCSSGCPAASIYDDFSPRDMMHKLSLGKLDELLKGESIWRCGQCYTCHSRCPRNNSPATVILVLRSLAVQRGYAADKLRRIMGGVGKNIMEKGVTLSPDLINSDFLKDFDENVSKLWRANAKVRKELGYGDGSGRAAPVPENAMREINALLELTGFKKIVYDSGDAGNGNVNGNENGNESENEKGNDDGKSG